VKIKTSITAAVAIATLCFCLAACAPEPTGKPSGSDSADVAFEWTESSDCSVCHVDEAETQEDPNRQIAAMHSAVACISCHNDVGGLEQAHSEVELDDNASLAILSVTEVSSEACKGCHDDQDYSPEACGMLLVDKNGLEVNPHDVPSNADHDTMSCGSCHDMHSSKSLEETARNACAECHHTGTYECYTCHE